MSCSVPAVATFGQREPQIRMQKQLSHRATWLLKTAYWLGYGSIPGVGGVVYYLYRAQLSEGGQNALFSGFLALHIFFSSMLGNWLASTTGHSQARRHKEVWTRTPEPLPQFPLLVVWSDKPYRDIHYQRLFWLSAIGTGLYLLYCLLFQRGEFIRSLGVLILPFFLGLFPLLFRREAPYELATASREGVRDNGTVPWDELARVEVRREYDYLGAPSLVALNLFDATGKNRGQVWLDADYHSRPEGVSLERFYEALRAEFAVEVVS